MIDKEELLSNKEFYKSFCMSSKESGLFLRECFLFQI